MQKWQQRLSEGQVIPACPLMLNEDGSWSRQHQKALLRYYREAGAVGIAVGVHTTQFAIRDPQHALFKPILELVANVLDQEPTDPGFIRVAGICGDTEQAIMEARLASNLGFHAGLLTTNAIRDRSESEILKHCTVVADEIPIFGFYLQPAIGGRIFSYGYWRRFCEIKNVVAIKIAAFNRYQTLDVIRAVIDSGREDISIYTGNDDNIIGDLLTPFQFNGRELRIVGGLLGQWAVWTRAAVNQLNQIKEVRASGSVPESWLAANAALTDANAAIFDAANDFAGCIPGVNEILRRSGLAPSARCLDPNEVLSPGQKAELDRVEKANQNDDDFIAANLQRWLEE